MLINVENERDAEEALRAVGSWVRDVERSQCDEVGEVLERLAEARRFMAKKITGKLAKERTMRGPWKVLVEEPAEGSETWSATIIDHRIDEATNAEALSRQEAIQKVQDQWSRVLQEDFGPQDFVVEER